MVGETGPYLGGATRLHVCSHDVSCTRLYGSALVDQTICHRLIGKVIMLFFFKLGWMGWIHLQLQGSFTDLADWYGKLGEVAATTGIRR